jgi:hypothetical protein
MVLRGVFSFSGVREGECVLWHRRGIADLLNVADWQTDATRTILIERVLRWRS